MKKFTLIAAFAAVAMSAAAQYNVDPTVETVLANKPEAGYQVDALILDQGSISAFEQAGCTVSTAAMVNDVNVYFYIWEGTFVGGDGSYPGVGMHTDGYTSLTVGNVGWSGAGLNVQAGANWNVEFTDDTHLHIGYRSNNAPTSVAFIVLDGDAVNGGAKPSPAKIAVGSEPFNDNGAVFPLVGTIPADGDWTAIDVKFSDLKKLYPAFNNVNAKGWVGNALSLLAGGVPGKDISLDAVYFYTPKVDGGVDGVAVDNNDAPAVYYNLQGVQVANPQGGLFIKKQGNKVEKVVL